MTPPRTDIPTGVHTNSSNSTTPLGQQISTPPTNPDLDFNISFGDTPGLTFSSASSSPTPSTSRSFVGSLGSSSGGGRLSPVGRMEGDYTRSHVATWGKGKARRVKTEPIFGFYPSPPTSCEGFASGVSSSMPRMKPKPLRERYAHRSDEGSDHRTTDMSSGSESDQTTSPHARLRSNLGSVMKMVHPFGFVEQRYLPPPVPTPYYTAKSTPDPEFAPAILGAEPQAGPSRLPPIDTSVTPPIHLSPEFPLVEDSEQTLPRRLTSSPPPPSPAPTADFSMISPPNSPSFMEYSLSQYPVSPRGHATLPFFRSHPTSASSAGGLPGVFHRSPNGGRTRSLSLGKPRRSRPGISRLWESIASPSKSSSPSPFESPNASRPINASSQRGKSAPVSGFSAVRTKSSPMRGVRRKLRERRGAKRVRQSSTPEVETDVDYGALDPLDGEEGELVGCTCSGWGDGACVCGYGYWEVYDYEGYIQESKPARDPIPSRLTQLPPELFLHVLSYLPVRSVLVAASTCKAWRTLALDNSVWWRLWQAREGIPHLPSTVSNPCPDHGRRLLDSFSGFGRRYRGIKDEGVHGLSLNTPEHEQDDRWDIPSGWAIDFDRANLMLRERACSDVFIQPEKLASMEENDGAATNEDGHLADSEKEDSPASAIAHPAVSRKSPLMLDWRRLYRDRALLEQRWRDPEGDPHTLKIDGHRDSVYCLDFDSSRIITGSRDRTIKIWCIKTGKCIATFEGHTGSVLCLKFERDWDLGADGTVHGFMVSGSSDCTVCVWDLISVPVAAGERNSDLTVTNGSSRSEGALPNVTTGTLGPPRKVSAELRHVLRGHSAGVLDLKMDERWIVTCSKDALMNVYDRKTLTLHTVLSGHEGPVNAVGLENGRAVSASGDGKMILWDVETGSCIRIFEGHEKGLACIEFKNDLILSGSNDCTIKLWRASTGECLHTFAGHTLLVRALYFEPKTGYIVSTSYDRSVRVWEWREPKTEEGPDQNKPKGVGRLVREFRNLHASHIFDVKFDVGKIVSTSHDQKIIVLDFSHGIEGAPLFV